MVREMASSIQQGLMLKCHIYFQAITSSGNKNTLYNLSKERDEVLEI